MRRQSYAEFLSTLLKEPPIPCDFKVGDKVSFTNEYGITFKGYTVIGFAPLEDHFNGRFIHLDKEAWWFPKKPESLTKEHPQKRPHGVINDEPN